MPQAWWRGMFPHIRRIRVEKYPSTTLRAVPLPLRGRNEGQLWETL